VSEDLCDLELSPFFRASPEGRTGVSSYTGEGRHLGGIIGIPWPGVHVCGVCSVYKGGMYLCMSSLMPDPLADQAQHPARKPGSGFM